MHVKVLDWQCNPPYIFIYLHYVANESKKYFEFFLSDFYKPMHYPFANCKVREMLSWMVPYTPSVVVGSKATYYVMV